MPASDYQEPFSARIPFPEYLERNREQVVKLEVYRAGAIQAPGSGTFSLFDPGGVAIVDAEAISVVTSRAQYTIPAAVLPLTTPVGEGWQEEWVLTSPGGVTRTFRRSCAVVLRALFPVISDVDLLACYTDLDDLRPADQTSYQGYIDEAWRRVIGRLVARGRFPYLVLDPWSLREYTLETTLALVFADFGSSVGEGRYVELAEMHKRTAAAAWRNLNFIYDEDHDGKPSGSGKRDSAHPVIFLSNAKRGRWRY